jgi:hypothetical protein
MCVLSPLLRAELASFRGAGVPGGDETKEPRFVARSQEDRKIPSAKRLSSHPVISLSLTIDQRLAKDDLVDFVQRDTVTRDVILAVRFGDDSVDPHPFLTPTPSL